MLGGILGGSSIWKCTRELEFWVVSVCEKRMGCEGENLVLFSSLSTDLNGQGEREWGLASAWWWSQGGDGEDLGCQLGFEKKEEDHGRGGVCLVVGGEEEKKKKR